MQSTIAIKLSNFHEHGGIPYVFMSHLRIILDEPILHYSFLQFRLHNRRFSQVNSDSVMRGFLITLAAAAGAPKMAQLKTGLYVPRRIVI